MNTKYLGIALFIVIFSGCKKLEIEREIRLSSTELINLGSTFVKVQTSVLDHGNGIKEIGYCWSTSTNPAINSNSIIKLSIDSSEIINATITNLLPEKTYYIAPYTISESNHIKYGEQQVCKTLAISLPELGSNKKLEISDNHLQVKAQIISYGKNCSSFKQYGHCWSTLKFPTIEDEITVIDKLFDSLSFVSDIKGLKFNTVYYIRSYAINEQGINYGDQIVVKTKILPPYFHMN